MSANLGADGGVSVGQMAPDFTLFTPMHGLVSLSQFRGERHLALVFFRTFRFGGRFQFMGGGGVCPTCHLMLRDLVAHYDQIRELGAEVLAVSTVTPEDLQKVLEIGEPRFPLGADADTQVARTFGVYDSLWKHNHPSSFLVDREGIVRYRHVALVQTDLPRSVDLLAQLSQVQTPSTR